MTNRIYEAPSVFDSFRKSSGAAPVSFFDRPPEEMTDHELLRAILRYALPDEEAHRISEEIYNQYGSLGRIAATPSHLLTRDHGLPDSAVFLVKSFSELFKRLLNEEIRERPSITSWSELTNYIAASMRHDCTEQLRILFLDRKNKLIRDEITSRGTVDHTPLYPREIVKRALELDASALIIIHNHPSGDPTPSKPDVDMTGQIINALRTVNITVHDHIIVGANRHTSFRSEGLMR